MPHVCVCACLCVYVLHTYPIGSHQFGKHGIHRTGQSKVVEPKCVTTQLSRIAQSSELLQALPITVRDVCLNNVCCVHIHRQAILIVAHDQLLQERSARTRQTRQQQSQV